MKIRKLLYTFLIWRNIFTIPMYLREKHILDMDMNRYIKMSPYAKPGVASFNYLMLSNHAFRSIFYYRCRNANAILRGCAKMLIHAPHDIEIDGEIGGGGLCLFHNQGRVIYPYKCGINLEVSQGVTIGAGINHPDKNGNVNPVLGDNVSVATNAVVIGGINIGDNAYIGAGAVVTKSVPENCTVVGNPARIIRRNGERVNISL